MAKFNILGWCLSHAAVVASPPWVGIMVLMSQLDQPKTPPIRDLEPVVPPRDLVKQKAAELYGRGYTTPQIAQVLLSHISPNSTGPLDQRLRAARAVLRRWKNNEAFRDLVYSQALVELDLDTPLILKGISKKARKGRVDAARLALELTGRHSPKGDLTGAVTIQIANIPRPESRDGVVIQQKAIDQGSG